MGICARAPTGTRIRSFSEDGARPAVIVPDPLSLDLLQRGEISVQGLLPYSSNYSFLGWARQADREVQCVYKPREGENPLADFPSGTLCQREVAAFLLSELLGWDLVPPTVLREAEYGWGSVQLFIPHDPNLHYFNVRYSARHADFLRRLALFDYIANNADRKSGHCLEDSEHRLWAIDHGICFHARYKVRTVIWEFSQEPVSTALLADLECCARQLAAPACPAPRRLYRLLSEPEGESMRARLQQLLQTGCYPRPRAGQRNFPWPPI